MAADRLHSPAPFVPNWWERDAHGRVARNGPAAPEAWLEAASRNQTLVTRIGTAHADHVEPGTVVPYGRWPAPSSPPPTLLATVYRHAMLGEGSRTLVPTGTGYGTALACRRLGDALVTSVDVGPYLVQAATDRLGSTAGAGQARPAPAPPGRGAGCPAATTTTSTGAWSGTSA